MSFRVIFSTKSSKKIRSLDSDLKERIKNAIEEMEVVTLGKMVL